MGSVRVVCTSQAFSARPVSLERPTDRTWMPQTGGPFRLDRPVLEVHNHGIVAKANTRLTMFVLDGICWLLWWVAPCRGGTSAAFDAKLSATHLPPG